MASYAALVSLMHIIKQVQHHPHPPISLDKEQVDSLTGNVTFLQSFLERYSSSVSIEEEDDLESRIAEAAYAAEDVIESHIADQIHAGSTSHGEKISSVDLYGGLLKVIQDMDLIKKEVENIREKIGAQAQLHQNSSSSTGSVGRSFVAQNNIMVDFGDVSNEVKDKLTGQAHDLQIIPIVGMGGIGKTTLARYIYDDPLIVQHFDIRAWVTISQEYNRNELLHFLCEQNNLINSDRQMSEEELGETLYKNLWGRRYLIVMDDIWRSEAWDEVKSFFPDNNNGSKIMITTRLSNLAFQLSGSHDFEMKFLDEDKSWDLLCKIVFGEEDCPSELEKIGKEISTNCRGLPLSIVVIGGVLAKSKTTQKYWGNILENLNSLINLENGKHCFQILRMSYKELPIYLKPCFLYMGVFPEDYKICVSDLIKLWVVEGFLKPGIDDKSLEIVAKEYFQELIDRNLILVHEPHWNGKVKFCKIHDLLRDLCVREAKKQRFLCILSQRDLNIPPDINIERRICIHKEVREEYSPQILHAMGFASLTRSLLLISGSHETSLSFGFRLLRVYSRFAPSYVRESITVEAIFQQANLRHLFIEDDDCRFSISPSPFSLLWNLQMLWIHRVGSGFLLNPTPIIAPSEIWKMPQLRHVMFLKGLKLPDPPGEEDFVLENLQTLSYICNFRCAEEVVKRIPNIRKLQLYYTSFEKEASHNFCLNNLGRLRKLESLLLFLKLGRDNPNKEMVRSHLVQNLTFPHSLKKLSLYKTKLQWEELNTKIGLLPCLEVLILRYLSCIGPKWETVEGQFRSLKFLEIEACLDLEHWTTDSSTHFPLLEHLFLDNLSALEEIPSVIGDIPTLQSIRLIFCSESAEDSARRIKKEQEEYGNDSLKVEIGDESREDEDED